MVSKLNNQIYAIFKNIIKPEKEFSFLSYVIKGNVNVLIDTLPERSADMLITDLGEILGEEKLDVLILNHSEEDHSGALEAVTGLYPDIQIYCTEECKTRLGARIENSNCHIVDTGEEVVLGEHTFQFIKTQGLHWDDNMVTFYKNDKILFSNDLFGQLAAYQPPMDSLYDTQKLMTALKAYFNRVFSESTREQRYHALAVLDLPIQLIAPGHGIVIEKQIENVLDYYRETFVI